VREQAKRPRRRLSERPPEDDRPRKIADACFWAADSADDVDMGDANEVDDAGDVAVVMMSWSVAVAIRTGSLALNQPARV
jgi:hypothetical protein